MASFFANHPLFISQEFFDQLHSIFVKGGIMMYPLTICSFIVFLITLEKILTVRSSRLLPGKNIQAWNNWFQQTLPPSDMPRSHSASILGTLLQSLASYFPLPQARLEERLSDLMRKEKHKLERGLILLDTIAGIAPLFGLLGTVLGMVEVFSNLSVAGEAKMSALSSGIAQALFTTVAGLCIGIPSLIAFNLLSRQIEKILIHTEDQLNTLIDRHYHLIIKE
jgi:biopolymer transport protein ExbB